jgi:hypothetical protein
VGTPGRPVNADAEIRLVPSVIDFAANL